MTGTTIGAGGGGAGGAASAVGAGSGAGSGSAAGGAGSGAGGNGGGRLRGELRGNVTGRHDDDARFGSGELVLLAVAEDHDPVGLDAAAEQEILGGLGAPFAQLLVGGRTARLVRVAHQPDRALIAVLEPGRHAGQGPAAIRVDLVRAGHEADRDAGVLAHRRRRRFSRDPFHLLGEPRSREERQTRHQAEPRNLS